MRYGQFSFEKRTLFLPHPFNFKFENVFLAPHRPNSACPRYYNSVRANYSCKKLSSTYRLAIKTSVTDRQTDDNL